MASTQDLFAALVFRTMGLPLLTTALALLATAALGRLLRRGRDPHRNPVDPGIATAAALWGGVIGARGLPRWPVSDTLDLLGPLALGISLVAWAIRLLPSPRRGIAEVVLWALGSLGIGRVVLVPSGAPPAATSVGLGALAIGWAWLSGAVGRKGEAPGAWFATLTVAAMGSAVVLGTSGSALLGQVMASVVLPGAMLALLAFLRPWSIAPGPSATAAFAAAHGGILAYAWSFTESPRALLALVLVVPASLFAGPLLGRRAPRLLPLATAVLLSGIAVAWAIVRSGESPPYPY